MKVSKHMVGEIFYNEVSNKLFVITDIFENIYCMGYIPAPERWHNPLRYFNAGGYSDHVFDHIFKHIGDV